MALHPHQTFSNFVWSKIARFHPTWADTYGLRPPTSWRFTHTRPRGNQRLFPLGTPSRPATFSLFTKQELRKVAMGIDPAFNFICNRLRPYSKMLTLPMVHPVPRKLAWRPVRLTLFSSTASSSELNHIFQASITKLFMPQSELELKIYLIMFAFFSYKI